MQMGLFSHFSLKKPHQTAPVSSLDDAAIHQQRTNDPKDVGHTAIIWGESPDHVS